MEPITISAKDLTCDIFYDGDKNALYYIADDKPQWYYLTAVNDTYNEPEPRYKLRKCECCGGPLKGLTCSYCGAEYERY